MDTLRLLHAAGGALLTQAGLHGQLARLDWAEEKSRLQRVLVTGLLGFASLLSSMVFVGMLAMAAAWDTVFRLPAVIAVIAVYGLATAIAWHRLRRLSAQGNDAFAATRAELAADIALVRGTQ